MNLTELQVQLRSIENSICALQTEIEKMKPRPEEESIAILEKITAIAKPFPLSNKHFQGTSPELKRTYITCLAYITLSDNNSIYEKLLYLCRLAYGMGLSVSAEEIYRMGVEVDKAYFYNACEELKSLRFSFLTDALALINITEDASYDSFVLIADMAAIMNCEKEDLRAAAMVAKGVLTGNFDILKQLPCPRKNCWMGQFREHIPNSWLIAQRKKCGDICMSRQIEDDSQLMIVGLKKIVSYVIKDKVEEGAVVKAGDILVTYEKCVESNSLGALSIINTMLSNPIFEEKN